VGDAPRFAGMVTMHVNVKEDSSLTEAMPAARLGSSVRLQRAQQHTPHQQGWRRASYEAAGRDTVSAAATAVMPTPNSSASHHRRACSTSASAAPSAASCSRHLRRRPHASHQTGSHARQTAAADARYIGRAQTQLARHTGNWHRTFAPDTHNLALKAGQRRARTAARRRRAAGTAATAQPTAPREPRPAPPRPAARPRPSAGRSARRSSTLTLILLPALTMPAARARRRARHLAKSHGSPCMRAAQLVRKAHSRFSALTRSWPSRAATSSHASTRSIRHCSDFHRARGAPGL